MKTTDKTLLIVKGLVIWLIILILYFFSSETIVKLLFPGFNDIILWLFVVEIGIVAITFLAIIVLIIKIRKENKKTTSNN